MPDERCLPRPDKGGTGVPKIKHRYTSYRASASISPGSRCWLANWAALIWAAQGRTGFQRDVCRQERAVLGTPQRCGWSRQSDIYIPPTFFASSACVGAQYREPAGEGIARDGPETQIRLVQSNAVKRAIGKQRAQIDRRRIRYQTAGNQPGTAHGADAILHPCQRSPKRGTTALRKRGSVVCIIKAFLILPNFAKSSHLA